MSHTPTPWTISRTLPGQGILISGADDAPVAVVSDDTTAYGQLSGIPGADNARYLVAAVRAYARMEERLRPLVMALADALDPYHQGEGWPDPIAWDGRLLEEQARDLLALAEIEIAQDCPSSHQVIAAADAVRRAL
jgi:hypothetical protein